MSPEISAPPAQQFPRRQSPDLIRPTATYPVPASERRRRASAAAGAIRESPPDGDFGIHTPR